MFRINILASSYNRCATICKVLLLLGFLFIYKKRIDDHHSLNQQNLEELSRTGESSVEKREFQFLSGIMKAILTIVATKICLKIVLAAFCSIYVVGGNKREAKRISQEIYGMDPEGDWMGRTKMHCAAAVGDVKALEKMLKDGSPVNCFAWDRTTPLHEAAYVGHMDCVRLLVQFGATINSSGIEGETPLSLSASQGHTQILNYLLNKGAKVNPAEEVAERYKLERIKSPLHEAVIGDHTESVKKILEYGGDANFFDLSIGLPLSVAANKGTKDIALLLLLYGAKASASSPSFKYLSEPDECKNMTALHFAAKQRHPEIVELLLEFGANLLVKNGSGKYPKDLCFFETSASWERGPERFLEQGKNLQIFNFKSKLCHDILCFYESHPRCLKSLCRITLRENVGANYISFLNLLKPPPRLKNYLMFAS